MRPEVVAVPLLCCSSVQCHPHPQGPGLPPFGGEEPALRLQGGFQGVRSGRKGSTEGVPHGLEDVPIMNLNRFTEHLVVAGEGFGHSLWASLPELGGSFYIGEQECDCACGRAGHHLNVLLASLERTL